MISLVPVDCYNNFKYHYNTVYDDDAASAVGC